MYLIRRCTVFMILIGFSFSMVSISAQEATEVPDAETIAVTIELPVEQADLSVITGNVQRPNGMVYHDGTLYTVCNGDWTIYAVDADTGDTVTYVFGVRNAHALLAEETETGFDLTIPDFDQNGLFIVDETRGAPSDQGGSYDSPWGIARLDAENILVTNLRSNDVIRVHESGVQAEVASGFRSPTGIAIDGDTVYIANTGSARRAIQWFTLDAEGNQLGETQTLVSNLQNVTNLELAADGYLYFTYAQGTRGVIGRVEPSACLDGGCTDDDIELVVVTDLPAPLAGLTITSEMRLFIHAIYRPEIYSIELAPVTS